MLLLQVVSSRNAEEQIASKPIELPQQQDGKLPSVCQFGNPLEAGSVLRPLGSGYPGITYNVDQRVSLRLCEAADRPLLNLQTMAGGSLFFRGNPDVANSLGGDSLGLDGSVGRSGPEQPDPVATVHLGPVQILLRICTPPAWHLGRGSLTERSLQPIVFRLPAERRVQTRTRAKFAGA